MHGQVVTTFITSKTIQLGNYKTLSCFKNLDEVPDTFEHWVTANPNEKNSDNFRVHMLPYRSNGISFLFKNHRTVDNNNSMTTAYRLKHLDFKGYGLDLTFISIGAVDSGKFFLYYFTIYKNGVFMTADSIKPDQLISLNMLHLTKDNYSDKPDKKQFYFLTKENRKDGIINSDNIFYLVEPKLKQLVTTKTKFRVKKIIIFCP